MAKRLNELEKGDKVAYTDKWYSISWGSHLDIWEPAIIEKDTDTQLTVNGMRFNRRNGVLIGQGGSYGRHTTRIVPWSVEIEKEIEETNGVIAEYEERRKLSDVINRTKIKDLPLEKLRAIVSVIEAKEE